MSEKPIPENRMGNLFSTKKEAGQSSVMSHESRITKQDIEVNHESLLMKHESGIMSIDQQALNQAITQGRKDPRISTYSPLVMSVLRYLRKTTPEFSMSQMASDLLENAIREKYPELSRHIEKALVKK